MANKIQAYARRWGGGGAAVATITDVNTVRHIQVRGFLLTIFQATTKTKTPKRCVYSSPIKRLRQKLIQDRNELMVFPG